MNRIQMISQQIETDRLKLQMGLSPAIDIDTLTLRAMWYRLCAEGKAADESQAMNERLNGHPSA